MASASAGAIFFCIFVYAEQNAKKSDVWMLQICGLLVI